MNIETYIRENRQVLDNALPDAHVWQHLNRLLNRLPHADPLEKELLCNRILLDTAAPPEAMWRRIADALDASSTASPQRDPLEQFILEHRDALDSEVPDLKIWGQISAATPEKIAPGHGFTVHWGRNLMRAAAAIALLITGIGMGIWYASHSNAAAQGMAMSELSDQYRELEQYYQRDIAGKQVRLASMSGSQPVEVLDDLRQLDQIMEELRKELADVPPASREQVVRAMIENYKAKTTILQRVLEHLEDGQPEQQRTKGNQNESKDI
jgi:DNA-directed RNA polymerase subunit F